MTAVHKISVRAGGKHTLSPVEIFHQNRRVKFWETTLTIDRARFMVANTIKNAYRN